jgi:hypothetical protein
MVDGILGGLSNFAGGVGDFLTGGGVYADPKNINQRYGVPEADVRQAGLGALGNVGALLLAAGQSPDRGQRAQFLGQLGGAVSGMNTDIFKSSQARLMTAQQQQAMREIDETNALGAEIKRLGPEGFKAQYKIDPRGIGLKDLREALTKIRITEATMSPADRAKAEARNLAAGYFAPPQAAPDAFGGAPTGAPVGVGQAQAPQAGQPTVGGVSPSAARRIADDKRIQSLDPALAKQYADLANAAQSAGEKEAEIIRARSAVQRIENMPKVEMAIANKTARTQDSLAAIEGLEGRVGVTTTGPVAWASRNTPGTPAFNFLADAKSLKSRIGLDELIALKDAGGTLGTISNFELQTLQEAIANIDTAQNPEQVTANLNKIKTVLRRSGNLLINAFEKEYGRAPDIKSFLREREEFARPEASAPAPAPAAAAPVGGARLVREIRQ